MRYEIFNNEMELSVIMANTPVAIFLTDAVGRVVRYNNLSSKILGVDLNKIADLRIDDIFNVDVKSLVSSVTKPLHELISTAFDTGQEFYKRSSRY